MPPTQFDLGFGFWVTLRREANFGFFSLLVLDQPFRARESPSQLTDFPSNPRMVVKCFP